MRLLVVDDDDHAVAALNSQLRRHGFDITRARTVAQGIHALQTRPDLVLLDLDLPDGDGLAICDHLQRSSNTPVIVVTAGTGLPARLHGLYRGADDYLAKPFDLRELLARIHAIIRRRPLTPAPDVPDPDLPCPDPLRAVGTVSIHLPRREVAVAGRPVHLTRKEFDLLAELARAPGVVFRREQLLSEIWGSYLPETLPAASRTLEVHVSSLRHKLGDPSMVQSVRGIGYRLMSVRR